MNNKISDKLRSSHWPALRKKFIKANPKCAICGKSKKLEAHHIQPFHLFPILELDETNLIALCEGNKEVNCHLIFGHLGNFRTKYNLQVIQDAGIWNPRLLKKS